MRAYVLLEWEWILFCIQECWWCCHVCIRCMFV